jgi:hypothetical protein
MMLPLPTVHRLHRRPAALKNIGPRPRTADFGRSSKAILLAV